MFYKTVRMDLAYYKQNIVKQKLMPHGNMMSNPDIHCKTCFNEDSQFFSTKTTTTFTNLHKNYWYGARRETCSTI